MPRYWYATRFSSVVSHFVSYWNACLDCKVLGMKKDELARLLEAEGVREDMYWLEGGLPNESHTLERRENGWAVYYSERGERNVEELFATEDEACAELYSRIMDDPTAR